MATKQTQAPATQAAAPCAVVLVEGRKQLTVNTLGSTPMPAAPNVLARAGTLANLAAPRQGLTLRAGTPCRVRVPYTVACWQAVEATLAKHGGAAPAPVLAAASTGDFVQYAMRRKWLQPA